MSENVPCPIELMPTSSLAIPLSVVEMPDEPHLLGLVEEGIGRLPGAWMRDALGSYLARGFAHVQVLPASDPTLAPLLADVRLFGQPDDPLLVDAGITWWVLIDARGALMPPMAHIWFARAASYILATHFAAPVVDLRYALVDERFLRAEFCHSEDGFVQMRAHLRFVASMATGGQARITSLGMHVFGLPEIELPSCPLDMLAPAQGLVLATAQCVLHHALDLVARLAVQGEDDEPQVLVLPATLDLPWERVAWATGAEPQATDLVAPQVGMALAPATATSPTFLQLVAPAGSAHAGHGWVRHAIATLDRLPPADIALVAPGASPPPQLDLAGPEVPKTRAELRALFVASRERLASLAVKCEFFGESALHSEHMWVAVERWEGGQLHGELLGDSLQDEALSAGVPVAVGERSLSAYRLAEPSGVTHGGPISD